MTGSDKGVWLHVFLLVTLVIGGCSDTPSKKGESTKPASEILFSHDQQPATNIQDWGETWLVTSRRVLSPGKYANRFFELDLVNMAAKELLLPGKGENLAVATNQQGQQFVLVRGTAGIVLNVRTEGEWRPISIPKRSRWAEFAQREHDCHQTDTKAPYGCRN